VTWEYIAVKDFDAIDLNSYEASGWKLINIVVFRDGSFETWMKRPLPSKPAPKDKPL
jgi:hypothetical protein